MSPLSTRWLIAGSLFGAVLTSCVSQGQYDDLVAYNQQLEYQLAQERQQHTLDERRVSRLQSGIKHTVESDLLFEEGSWEMSEAGKKTISSLAEKLAPTQENKLIVIGHTDNVPIGPELEAQGITSNEELSLRRAEAVREFLISKGFDPNMISAEGRGESNPVARNNTAKGRAQNRRVELSLGG